MVLQDPNSHMKGSATGNTLVVDLMSMSNQMITFKPFCQHRVMKRNLGV